MGGMQSLASYGGTRKHATGERARKLIDARHIHFLSALPLTHVAGGYLFVHAGIEPEVPLHRQEARKLMTIRRPFLTRQHRLPYVVVHGHTPTPEGPQLGPGRIGVDTGACTTGILTALAIGPGVRNRRFLSVKAMESPA
jgi:serine/threonine protein phosphatase 1